MQNEGDVAVTVAELTRSMQELEARVRRLEQSAPVIRRAEVTAPPLLAEAEGPVETDRENQIALIGRTIVALGGAWLLRAITDSGVLPQTLGVALGLAFAMVWLVFALRASRSGAETSATLHGLTAILIAYPLLFEATRRFEVLGAVSGVILLALVTAAAFGTAWRGRLHGLAWLVLAGATGGGLLLLAATEALPLYVLFFTALAVAALWAGYVLDWRTLRWPAAALADALLLLLVVLAHEGKGGFTARVAIAVALTAFTLWVGSFAIRTLALGRSVIRFEAIQCAAILLIAIGGTGWLTPSHGALRTSLGAGLAILAAVLYGVAFAFLERRSEQASNFSFYATLAIVLGMYGTALLVSGRVLMLLWMIAGVTAAALSDRFQRGTLAYHAAALVIGAAFADGSLLSAMSALALPRWSPIPITALLAAAVAAGAYWLIGRSDRELQARAIVPRTVLLVLLVILLGGLLVEGASRAFSLDAPAVLAMLRTSVVSLAAIALAFAARHPRMRAATTLIYPILLLGGIRITIEDLRVGTPGTLFVSFVLYGTALLLAPRLRRAARSMDAAPAGVSAVTGS